MSISLSKINAGDGADPRTGALNPAAAESDSSPADGTSASAHCAAELATGLQSAGTVSCTDPSNAAAGRFCAGSSPCCSAGRQGSRSSSEGESATALCLCVCVCQNTMTFLILSVLAVDVARPPLLWDFFSLFPVRDSKTYTQSFHKGL